MTIKIFVFYIASLFLIADACTNHKTCKQCITDPNICVWCTATDPDYDKQPRCRPQGSFAPTWCSGQLEKAENAPVVTKTNKDFSSILGAEVQIKPQMYDMKLRPGQPLNFTFSFQKAEDYPVDLYILVDASNSMSKVHENLWSHSKTIYETMQNMTKNVNMGLGTFIDKNTAPYNLQSNKHGVYSFKNQLNLTGDYTKFKQTVKDIKVAKNFDPPEGGFEALAQVLACNVNWRISSRKIVLFLTDNLQHVVGNGRTAGILQPFDSDCHLNDEGYYTKELKMDYPSLTDINLLASNKAVTIIFTLKDTTHETFFTNLVDIISASRVAILKNNDVVTTLESIYKEISTNIKLGFEVQSGSSNYEVQFYPDCASDGDYCRVETGQSRNFTGTITLKEYNGRDSDKIHISIQGMEEKLTLNVDVIQCSCEDKGTYSDHCFGQKLLCGTCICDDTRHGNRCMCKKGAINTDDSLCIAPKTELLADSAEAKLCSGEGHCECGLCNCKKGRLGKFCECNVRSCPGHDSGAECGGHGKCTCSGPQGATECACNKGWTLKPGAEHLGCVCEDAKDLCVDSNNRVCNNRGSCTCNSCVCQNIADWDRRIEQDEFCNIKPCPSCHTMQCSALRNCVRCRLNAEHCYTECAGIFLHEKIYDILSSNLSSVWNLCPNEKLDTGCYTQFAYKYDDKAYRILLLMQEDADCAENYYKFGGIILISVLLIGILTLLAWKCLTRYQDIKEYRKFESQHKEDLNAPCLNPLYDEPRTFRNPAFKKSFS